MTTSATQILTTPAQGKAPRIESIDLLRGIVMIVMALDHVRDYFHADAYLFNPLDLDKTNWLLFITRWITHFCAPVFVFLAGTSAFLIGQRKNKSELSKFLLQRGIWLIVLELTIINFSWFFNIQFSLITLTVIWALGMGMVILAAAVRLPFYMVLVLGAVLVAGHNALDGVHLEGQGAGAVLWAVLHEFKGFQLGHFFLFVGYPLIPWIGIMLLGYCFGLLYSKRCSAERRRKALLWLGAAALGLFVAIRFTNVYGDMVPWAVQSTPLFTFFSFINVSKYPPSLLYVLVTLGPALLFLSVAESFKGTVAGYVTALGRVPLFYYVIHLYLIHVLALFAAIATGFQPSDMVFTTWITDSPKLKGYGFGLGVVYAVWAFVVLTLYPICLWYDRYKSKHREKWWLSYL